MENKEEKKQEVKKQWKVAKRFYDLKQKRIVEVGEVVAHTKNREDQKLIK